MQLYKTEYNTDQWKVHMIKLQWMIHKNNEITSAIVHKSEGYPISLFCGDGYFVSESMKRFNKEKNGKGQIIS